MGQIQGRHSFLISHYVDDHCTPALGACEICHEINQGRMDGAQFSLLVGGCVRYVPGQLSPGPGQATSGSPGVLPIPPIFSF
jgi:hypothetical protein